MQEAAAVLSAFGLGLAFPGILAFDFAASVTFDTLALPWDLWLADELYPPPPVPARHPRASQQKPVELRDEDETEREEDRPHIVIRGSSRSGTK